MFINFNKIPYIILCLFLFVGCTTRPLPSLPKVLRPPIQSDVTPTPVSETIKAPEVTQVPPHTQFLPTPKIPPSTRVSPLLGKSDFLPPLAKGSPVRVNIEGLPLPAFIHEVFGNLLGLSFEIEANLQNRKELVTLRVNEPQLPTQLYQLARQVLDNYNVAVQPQGKLFRFVVKKQQEVTPSLISTGMTLPEVPVSHRPIFHFLTLKVATNSQIVRWIRMLFKNYDINILEDPHRNALILIGKVDVVQQVVKAAKMFDQPWVRGQHSIQIKPAFLKASALANRLVSVLSTQGYAASTNPFAGSIILLPIKEINIIIAFAADAQILAFVQQWAAQLDRPTKKKKDKKKPEIKKLFIYPVKNTSAQSILEVLNDLINDITAGHGKKPAKLKLDKERNSLIFMGSNEVWKELLPILQDLDKPTKQVLIEATVAEILLSDDDKLGIEWILNKANLGGLSGSLGTLGGFGVGSAGLTYTLSNAAETRAVLNIFASSSRATILSTPRLMVRSGGQASIDVGTEIPTLSSQSTTNQMQEGNTAILQQIQYRRTGVLLNIKPTIYAGRRVELDISQEVSEAQPNVISNIDSPSILNRKIDTQLTLMDGHSVLLGGLISSSNNEGTQGIPILSDIPLLGRLFRVDSKSTTRTELIIMIIPYVINDEVEAKAITENIRQKLEFLPKYIHNEPVIVDKVIE